MGIKYTSFVQLAEFIYSSLMYINQFGYGIVFMNVEI